MSSTGKEATGFDGLTTPLSEPKNVPFILLVTSSKNAKQSVTDVEVDAVCSSKFFKVFDHFVLLGEGPFLLTMHLRNAESAMVSGPLYSSLMGGVQPFASRSI